MSWLIYTCYICLIYVLYLPFIIVPHKADEAKEEEEMVEGIDDVSADLYYLLTRLYMSWSVYICLDWSMCYIIQLNNCILYLFHMQDATPTKSDSNAVVSQGKHDNVSRSIFVFNCLDMSICMYYICVKQSTITTVFIIIGSGEGWQWWWIWRRTVRHGGWGSHCWAGGKNFAIKWGYLRYEQRLGLWHPERLRGPAGKSYLNVLSLYYT